MAKVVIGLVGQKASGKTTSYDIIKKELAPVHEIQLAKKLKDVCSTVFNLDRNFMDDPKLKEVDLPNVRKLTLWKLLLICIMFNALPKFRTFKQIGKVYTTARQILQHVGTEVLRDIDSNIHLKAATKGVPKHGVFIATDIRFKGEMEYLHKWAYPYAWFFYIDRNIKSIDKHASETEIVNLKKHCVHIINNKGTLEDLTNQLKSALIWVSNELPYIGYMGYKRQLERVKNQKWKSSDSSLVKKFFKLLGLS